MGAISGLTMGRLESCGLKMAKGKIRIRRAGGYVGYRVALLFVWTEQNITALFPPSSSLKQPISGS